MLLSGKGWPRLDGPWRRRASPKRLFEILSMINPQSCRAHLKKSAKAVRPQAARQPVNACCWLSNKAKLCILHPKITFRSNAALRERWAGRKQSLFRDFYLGMPRRCKLPAARFEYLNTATVHGEESLKHKATLETVTLATRQLRPIHLFREVFFQFSDAPTPVRASLLADQLNVEKRALARPEHVARSGSTHNSRRHVGDGVLIKFKAHSLIDNKAHLCVHDQRNKQRLLIKVSTEKFLIQLQYYATSASGHSLCAQCTGGLWYFALIN